MAQGPRQAPDNLVSQAHSGFQIGRQQEVVSLPTANDNPLHVTPCIVGAEKDSCPVGASAIHDARYTTRYCNGFTVLRLFDYSKTRGTLEVEIHAVWRVEIMDLLTTGQVARQLGVPRARVDYAIDKGGIRERGRAGIFRLFAPEQVPVIAAALATIKVRTTSTSEVPADAS